MIRAPIYDYQPPESSVFRFQNGQYGIIEHTNVDLYGTYCLFRKG
jgi:hypothetical protein